MTQGDEMTALRKENAFLREELAKARRRLRDLMGWASKEKSVMEAEAVVAAELAHLEPDAT